MTKRWRRALITGASAGIGEAFARELAGRGCGLVLVARRREALEDLATALRASSGVEVEVLAADLTDSAALFSVEERLAAAPAVDLLVNNAGGSVGNGRGPFLDQPREVLHHQALLNAVAVMRLTHAALGPMVEAGGGNIIQISGGTAFYPVPYGSVYSAGKAFVNSFTCAVAEESRGSGVGLTTVCPGFTRTDAPRRIGFTEKNIPSWWWSDPKEVVMAALSAAARGKVVCSPGFVNRVNALVGSHFPATMTRVSARITRPPGGDRATR